MCLLAVCEPGSHLTDDQIDTAWDNNPHGGGFAHIGKGGRVRPFRTLGKATFIDAYHQAVRRHPDSPFLVHFRLATSGTTDMTNVHPFRAGEHTYMAHNGILPVAERHNLSDTHTFAKDWLPAFPDDWLDNHVLKLVVEEFAGTDKLAFLTTDPGLRHTYYILNEDKGTWDDGVWFSNHTHEHRIPLISIGGRDWRLGVEDNGRVTCLMCGNTPGYGSDGRLFCDGCGICWDCGEFDEVCGCERMGWMHDDGPVDEADVGGGVGGGYGTDDSAELSRWWADKLAEMKARGEE